MVESFNSAVVVDSSREASQSAYFSIAKSFPRLLKIQGDQTVYCLSVLAQQNREIREVRSAAEERNSKKRKGKERLKGDGIQCAETFPFFKRIFNNCEDFSNKIL